MKTDDFDPIAASFDKASFESWKTPALLQPSEILLNELEDAGLIKEQFGEERETTLCFMEEALDKALANHTTREAEYGYQLLLLFGAFPSKKTRLDSEILQALILKNDTDKSWADIARKYGMTRANISKKAKQWRAALGLKLEGFGRNDRFAEQCTTRSNRVHGEIKADKKRAAAIRQTKK